MFDIQFVVMCYLFFVECKFVKLFGLRIEFLLLECVVVIGSGIMGVGIVVLFLFVGLLVKLLDMFDQVFQVGYNCIKIIFQNDVIKGCFSEVGCFEILG